MLCTPTNHVPSNMKLSSNHCKQNIITKMLFFFKLPTLDLANVVQQQIDGEASARNAKPLRQLSRPSRQQRVLRGDQVSKV
jgi:hypothetical protein